MSGPLPLNGQNCRDDITHTDPLPVSPLCPAPRYLVDGEAAAPPEQCYPSVHEAVRSVSCWQHPRATPCSTCPTARANFPSLGTLDENSLLAKRKTLPARVEQGHRQLGNDTTVQTRRMGSQQEAPDLTKSVEDGKHALAGVHKFLRPYVIALRQALERAGQVGKEAGDRGAHVPRRVGPAASTRPHTPPACRCRIDADAM